jgi:hypothetical protein
VTMPEGQAAVVTGSAKSDAAAYDDDPEEFDISRKAASCGPQLERSLRGSSVGASGDAA